MLIKREELEGLAIVSEGYKVFNNDWTAKHNNYCYADEEGRVVGTIHRQKGYPKKCKYGLHYCENPMDCMKYYNLIQWNKFARVRGYGNYSRNEEDSKVSVEVLEIVQELSFREFIEAIKGKVESLAVQGQGISGGYGISGGRGIRDGYGISNGQGIRDGYGISGGYGIRNGYGISGGYGIRNGRGIRDGYGINEGYGISRGRGINNGWGISNGQGIRDGYGINEGYGISNCRGVYRGMFLKDCEGISCSIMCVNKTGGYMIFNKKVSHSYFETVYDDLLELCKYWYPRYNNALELYQKNSKEWECVPAEKIETTATEGEAYHGMPEKLVSYLKALPQYEEEIFNEITGRKVG